MDSLQQRPTVDADAELEDLLLRLGLLAEGHPEIAELDLNPVLVGTSGRAVVDVKLRLADVGPEPDPYLRDLLRQEAGAGGQDSLVG